ncbi:MAG: hypothetical protein IPP56_16775 [Bacteroidetes bacterium]|nr:hypothetical protein [Bacteroidota bacterium]
MKTTVKKSNKPKKTGVSSVVIKEIFTEQINYIKKLNKFLLKHQTELNYMIQKNKKIIEAISEFKKTI